MEINEALKVIGLSERESKVYLACLKLGSTTVNQISKEAGTFRTYTYDILNSLMERGLVSSMLSGKKQCFDASNPERIVEILKEKEEQVASVLPKLKELQHSSTKKPTVEFYEGLAGLNVVHDSILQEKPDEIRVYGNPEKHYEIMKFYLPRFVKKRVKMKIGARVIIKDSQVAREWMKGKEKEELRETRFFKDKPNEFPAVTYMWNDKMAHFTVEKKIIAVIIQDESIAKSQKVIFESIWKMAQK